MPIELKNLPSLIAIPYSETLKKDSIQRKDFQRLTLENALTFNAIIAIADFYNHNRKRSDESDKKMNILPNVPNIDLGQISVGTWNMFSREFTRVLKTDPKSAFLSNVIDLYHGSTAKEWENIAGTLITIRNKDAHGELIAADKLTAELDKRQEIVDKLMNMLTFYNDYLLIVPYKQELIEGKLNYMCKEFNGLTESTITISDSKDELEMMRVYLFNKKNSTALCLNPMIVASSTSNENPDIKLFLYSKTNNKKLGNLHFLAIDSSRDFNFDVTESVGEFFTPAQICEEFQSFRYVVEDPSLHDQKKPELSIIRTLKSDFISKNDLIEMLVKIKNSGEAIAENMEIKFNYAKNHFSLCNRDGEPLTAQNAIQEIIGDELNLESGQTFDYSFFFKPNDSGQYEFPSFTIEYEYTDYQGNTVKPKIDKEGVAINTEQVSAVYCTVFDPGDPFSLAPVINVRIDLDFGKDDKGADRIYAYIGETVPLTVTLKNQGLGVAKNVDFSVFLPQGIEITGSSKHWNGNINPLQTITKTYDLTLKEPGIHSINIREIIYFNNDNDSFKTTGGSYSLLVRNKPEVQYRQLIQSVWADLNLDEDEKDELNYFFRKYGKLISPESMINIEVDEKIKVIKSAISTIAVSKGFKLVEKIASGDRILFGYNSFECPILVIDFSERKNLKLFLRADLQGKYPKEFVTIKGILRTIEMNKIGFDEPIEGTSQSLTGGINLLKGILGRAIGWIEKHDWLQLQMRNFFAKSLSISNEQLSAKLFTRQFYYKIESESKDSEYMIKEFATYFDSKNNLHLVAKVDADITTRKKLVEKGYKYMGSQPKESEIAYTDSTNATTYLYVGTQKLNSDEDKQRFANKLVQLLMTALEDQNNFLEDVLKKKGIEPEQVNAIMQTHNSLLQLYEQEKAALGLKGLIFKMNYEDKGKNYNLDITYYAIKELPLYQEKQIVLKMEANRKNLTLLTRNLTDNLIEQLADIVKVNKQFYIYEIDLENAGDRLTKDIYLKFLTESNKSSVTTGYYYLKSMLENEWVASFDALLGCIVELYNNNDELTFQNLQNYFEENDINGKVQKILSMSLIPTTVQKVKPILNFDKSKKEVFVNNDEIELISKVLDTYQVNVKPEFLVFHKFKEIFYFELNEKKVGNLHNLIKKQANFFQLNHKDFYFRKGSHAIVTLRKDVIEIGVKITRDLELAKTIRSKYNDMLAAGIKQIQGLDVIEIGVKSSTADTNDFIAVILNLPFSNFEEIIETNWINKFVKIYNELYSYLIPEDYYNIFKLKDLN